MFSLEFPYAYGGPLCTADFRTQPEDFCVDEILGFQPSGEGEHFCVHLEKTNTNTEWLAKQLAEFCEVQKNDVGFCGLKDRHAVTTQWFSVYAPKAKSFAFSDWVKKFDGQVKILQESKHNKKLKRGQHLGNRFKILLRAMQFDKSLLQERLQIIAAQGVPNYFGEQRFGSNGNNLHAAHSWFVGGARLKGTQKKFAMSAARSYLFNQVLAARVEAGNWLKPIDGDVLLHQNPSAPLWGRGRSETSALAKEFELAAMEPVAAWLDGLEHCGLNQERRSLVLKPEKFTYEIMDNQLSVSFLLPGGEFATAVLREVAELNNIAQQSSGA